MNKENRKSNRGAALLWRNVTRGIVGAAKSRAYDPKGSAKPVFYKVGMQRMMLDAGRHLSPHDFVPFLSWATTQTELIPRTAQAVPTKYSLLSNFYDVEDIDFERQLRWTLARIQSEQARIRKFEQCFRLAEHTLLFGSGREIKQQLERIESEFGPSIRLLEAKLAVEQRYSGLEAQKKLAEKIKGKGKSGLIGFLTHYFSARNEPSMPAARFKDVISSRIAGMRAGSLRDYVSYRLASAIPDTPEIAARVLRIEESHSVFDLCETMRCMYEFWNCEAHAHGGCFTKWLPEIEQTLLSVGADFNITGDIAVEMWFATNRDFAAGLAKEPTHVAPVYRRILRALREKNALDLMDLRLQGFLAAFLRRESSRSSRQNLLSQLTEQLANRINLFDEIASRWEEIEKTSLNFRSFRLLNTLNGSVASRQLNWLDPWRPMVSVSLATITGSNTVHSSIAGSNLLTKPLEDATVAEICATACMWLARLWRDKSSDCLHRFLEFSSQANEQPLPRPLLVNIQLASIRAYMELECWNEVWLGLARLAVVKKVDALSLPLTDAFLGKKWRVLSPFASQIQLAICIDLYSRRRSDEEIETMKRYALEDFLSAYGASRPSDLHFPSLGVGREEFVYFLRFVCVQRTMELLPALNGSVALDNERRLICSMLLQLDKENASTYNDEIVAILHHARIAEGLRLVDSSRVHVDVDMLRKQCTSELQTDFARYRSLVQAGVGVSKNFEHVLRSISKPAIDDEWLKVPESEADDLLIDIIGVIRDRFLFDQQHGLDSYLGRRIRHNSLTGQMRAPLGQANLVTQFDTATQDYQPNTYWLRKLPQLSSEELSNIDQMLRSFARSFDEIGQRLCTEHFHIRSNEFPVGIFDLNLDSLSYHLLRSIAQQSAGIEDFIDACFARCWGRLGPSLSVARSLIRNATQMAVSKTFDELKAGLVASPHSQQLIELSAAVSTAQQSVSRQLEKISEWFNRRENDETKQSYSIEEAVNISVEACLTSHRGKNPAITQNVTGTLVLDAASLFVLADVFWIAIDNACTHSGVPQGVKIDIDVSWEEERGCLRVCVTNNVLPKAKNAESQRNVATIAEDIEKRRHNEGMRVEGKSGIKKVAALAYSGDNGRLDFGYREPLSFVLDVEIPILMSDAHDAIDSIAEEPSDECALG